MPCHAMPRTHKTKVIKLINQLPGSVPWTTNGYQLVQKFHVTMLPKGLVPSPLKSTIRPYSFHTPEHTSLNSILIPSSLSHLGLCVSLNQNTHISFPPRPCYIPVPLIPLTKVGAGTHKYYHLHANKNTHQLIPFLTPLSNKVKKYNDASQWSQWHTYILRGIITGQFFGGRQIEQCWSNHRLQELEIQILLISY